MSHQIVPIYSESEQKQFRLQICKLCIYSACNGNQANKCNIDTMVCTKSNNQNIIQKTTDIKETCPMQNWNFTAKTKSIYSGKPSCNCKK